LKRGKNHKVWQDGFHPVELNSNKKQEERLEYLPVRQGRLYKSAREVENGAYLLVAAYLAATNREVMSIKFHFF